MSICGGIAGRRGKNPVGCVIHNDAGSQAANAGFYNIWLRTHDLSSGFAHYYVGSDYTLQAEDDMYGAWHCLNYDGNMNYLSVEACQSMGNLKIFLQNEDKALRLMAQKFIQYNIQPNTNTVRLHRQFSSTVCPHRSVEYHGGTEATQQYFINKIKEYMGHSAPINTSTGTPENMVLKEDGVYMAHLFTIDKGKTIWYYNGECIKKLTHPDQINALNQDRKLNKQGDIPCVNYSSKAPWYNRLLEVCNLPTVKKFSDFHP